jgi:predicted ATPase
VTLYLVIGPPASGKTTWVKQQARHGDIVIDYDAIASVLTPVGGDPYDQPDAVKAVTKAARQAAIDAAVRLSSLVNVYIIHAMPSARLLADYRQRGAQVVTVDPGRDVVMARCKTDRPWRMAQAAKQWYATDTGRQSDDQSTIKLGQLSETW